MELLQALGTAANIMFLGMLCVLLFLVLLIIIINIVANVVAKCCPVKTQPSVLLAKTTSPCTSTEVIAAITIAIHLYRCRDIKPEN